MSDFGGPGPSRGRGWRGNGNQRPQSQPGRGRGQSRGAAAGPAGSGPQGSRGPNGPREPRAASQPPRDSQWRGQGQPHNRDRSGPRPQYKDNKQKNQHTRQHSKKPKEERPMGFKELEQISQSEGADIIEKINRHRQLFMKLLETPVEQKKQDVFALMLTLVTNAWKTSFKESKKLLLLEICNSKFVDNLKLYLMQLPYSDEDDKYYNKYYWTKENEFWDHFLTFCECIIEVSPATAVRKCGSLIGVLTKCCLDGLKERQGFELPEAYCTRLTKISDSLKTCDEVQTKTRLRTEVDPGEPPESFRELSVLPTPEELVNSQPFLRANVVDGSYQDKEHYLDVQFRLLREDCFGPLRDGIRQFMEDPKKKKYDSIRVYQNVKFLEPFVSKQKVGSTVKLDGGTMKRFKNVIWAHSKRLLFGCLVLFTKDHCRSFLIGTVLERDEKYLSKGKLPVSIVNIEAAGDADIYNEESYTMIECEVYFEPYHHVLKVLQDPSFPEHLAMSNYIIDVQKIPEPPAYLNPDTKFKVETKVGLDMDFTVLQEDTWPSQDMLGFDSSQYEAYKLALTHEFAVIQGPPGTGKTFIGVKIAETLLKNVPFPPEKCRLLVICYTNHALDQFLEALLPVTRSLARIGGRSRNVELESYNINNLRLKMTSDRYGTRNNSTHYYHEMRMQLKREISEFEHAQLHVEALDTGVLSYESIIMYVEECKVLEHYYKGKGKVDPLKHWLFEAVDNVEFGPLLEEMEHREEKAGDQHAAVDEDDMERHNIIYDDLDDDKSPGNSRGFDFVETSFSFAEAEECMKELLKRLTEIQEKRHPLFKEREVQREICQLFSERKLLQEMQLSRFRAPKIKLQDVQDVSTVPRIERWSLYYKWAEVAMQDLRKRIKSLEKQLQSTAVAYEEARMMVDLSILKGTKVVGMTTSGAARLRKLLIEIAPLIVVVEEAAEVLEAHIVTSLTKSCQHLILIGDHQQLRPSAACVRLARRYSLEVSLFERMVRNAVHGRRLRVQHRMRPALAELICPHIYPELLNHPSVEKFPSVRGVEQNLFFFTHEHREQCEDDSSSRTNTFEADMALRLANYLMQQGYQPEDVTILTAYSGQMFYLRRQRSLYDHLTKVKITVLDNYQGEESKIIVLSLVRNNSNDSIGFLGTGNRVCVALSRAREGPGVIRTCVYYELTSDVPEPAYGPLPDPRLLDQDYGGVVGLQPLPDLSRRGFAVVEKQLQSTAVAYEEARMMVDLSILKGTKVVGMTTSGAARLRKLLIEIAPLIVVVEEAAEVLEAHIVTSLTKSCQHLILIGDHQQLRPSAACVRLARRYSLEVSLFERMVRNAVHGRRLRVQHRMRPALAELICPHIYPELLNHPSVEKFPSVRGVEQNLFFFTHEHREQCEDDSSSRTNTFEADMALRLANYLMQQGYQPEDVTILTAYSGQMFYLRRQRSLYDHLTKVKITVLDNYQGEESKIIVLSLVRNNSNDSIGFLGTGNRVCVALSRAREGFYIFGNIEMLKNKSPLWSNIAQTLEESGAVGKSLKLKCVNHSEHITTIEDLADFVKVPEGGCLLDCLKPMPCGHACPRVCHAYDPQHAAIVCTQDCDRKICDIEGHKCPLRCSLKCQPCRRMVEKSLPCGHNKYVPCHKKPDDSTIYCSIIVSVIHPDCDHEVKKECSKEVSKVRCTEECRDRRLACGHACARACHVADDPHHERYTCLKPCPKSKKGCTAKLEGDLGEHKCLRNCFEDCIPCNVQVSKKRSGCRHFAKVECHVDVDATPCRSKCARALPCSHFCKKLCFQKCGDCQQKVKKLVPGCNHEVEIECGKEPTREMCVRKCERELPCGHACPGRCGQPCSPEQCELVRMDQLFDAPCGHKVQLPCHIYKSAIDGDIEPEKLLAYCKAPCGVVLRCGHICGGSCVTCRRGSLHVACAAVCHQLNICGHRCSEPCNQVCPPCPRRCGVRCEHSACGRLCGAPCTPCAEPCKRACSHSACGRVCGEPCDRAPCEEPCPALQACGHPCRGLCGEPCPKACRQCDPDHFPTDLLGDPYEDDDKLVQLQDCPHIMDVASLDGLMSSQSETVQIKTCPFCRQPVINTHRYKDRVNRLLKHEINPIKEKVYGTDSQRQTKKNEMALKIKKIIEKQKCRATAKENVYWQKACLKIFKIIKMSQRVRTFSLLQLDMNDVYLHILETVGDYCVEYKNADTTELNKEFMSQVKLICEVLAQNAHKISQQQQVDIGNELRRTNSMIQLAKILSKGRPYLVPNAIPNVAQAAKAAHDAVFTWRVFNEEAAVESLKKLEAAVKLSGIASKEERDMVVRAIGLKAGHWFKCPNGHFYCIGECGGAMQLGRCPDCGETIGGVGHRLTAGNTHAGEMDNSRFAAWSQETNMMANFRLD